MNSGGYVGVRGRIFMRFRCPLRAFATAAPWFITTLLFAGDGPTAVEVGPVFVDVADARNRTSPQQPTNIRDRAVGIQLSKLAAVRNARGGRLTFNLFDDVTFVGVVERVTARPGGYSLAGHLESLEQGHFNVAVHQSVAVGTVRAGQLGTYHIRYLGDGTHVVRQIDPASLPPCGVARARTRHFHAALVNAADDDVPRTHHMRSGDDGSMHDILVLYSDVTRQAAGGTSAIRAEIQLAIDVANDAYAESGITSRLRLVHMEEVEYDEATGWDGYTDHLVRLGVPDDGYFDHIHELRDRLGADLVCLIVEDTDPDVFGNGTCGLAPVMQELSPDFESLAFSVVSRECSADNWTLAHEVGHNQGCAHNRENASIEGLFPYSYGHHFTGDSRGWSTVMAYDDAENNWQRVGRFSNPDISYDGAATGVPIGTPGEAHNVSTVNSSSMTVARFRTTRYWVDLGWPGLQNGLFASPFATLADGLDAVPPGGMVVVKAGQVGGAMTLTKRLKINSWNGSTVIGAASP
jgi:hypothetical protein